MKQIREAGKQAAESYRWHLMTAESHRSNAEWYRKTAKKYGEIMSIKTKARIKELCEEAEADAARETAEAERIAEMGRKLPMLHKKVFEAVYIRNLKISEAAAELAYSEAHITRIAQECREMIGTAILSQGEEQVS